MRTARSQIVLRAKKSFDAVFGRLPNLLTAKQEKQLAKTKNSGRTKKARHNAFLRLFTGNLRLVEYMARSFADSEAEYQDLVQEGAIGLLEAVKRFEDRGCRFSTFAWWWIFQAMSRGKESLRLVCLPVEVSYLLNTIRKAGFQPEAANWSSDDEVNFIAKKAGLPAKTVRRVLAVNRKAPIKLQLAFPELKNRSNWEVDEPDQIEIRGRYRPVLEGLLNQETPEDLATRGECERRITFALSTLTQIEAFILRMRFGFGEREFTLIEIADELGMTREKVRQIEAKALRKLRHPDRAKPLKESYLEL